MSQTLSYIILGYDSNTTEIVWNGFPPPPRLSSGQELRLWYLWNENLRTLRGLQVKSGYDS